MATNYTTNYQLNQWEPADAVQRVDFNADNAKVDAALKSLSDQVVQKANQSALNTVISAVNQKADAATVSSLSQTVAGHTAAIAQLGNCEIYYTTYKGDGTGGEDAPCSRTFSHKPLLIAIATKDGSSAVAIRGAETAYRRATGAAYFKVSWGDKSVSWWHPDGGESQFNRNGTTYHLVVLLDMQG